MRKRKVFAYPSLSRVARVDVYHGFVSIWYNRYWHLNSDEGLMVSTPCRWDEGTEAQPVGWPAALRHSSLQPPPGTQQPPRLPRHRAAQRKKAPVVKPSLGDVRIPAIYHEGVLIRATMSFCFVLNNAAFGIETCQEPNDLAEQIEKNRAINCKGIHFVVNARACCEKQDCTQTALPCKSQSMCWQSILLNPGVSLNISWNRHNLGGMRRHIFSP